MPYIVTAKRRWDDDATNTGGFIVESRRAVATLDEAHAAISTVIYRGEGESDAAHHWQPFYTDAEALPEAGGTVGPLPDGTVIEVEPTTTDALRETVETSGYGSWPDCDPSDDEIIYAYNAALEWVQKS